MTDLRRLTEREMRVLSRFARGLEVTTVDEADLGEEAQRIWAHVRQENGHATVETLGAALRLEPTIDADFVIRGVLSADDTPPIEERPTRFRPLTLAELRTRPEPTWLVDRLLQAETLAVLEGVDGSYKSFCALDLGMSVATGRAWLGRPVRKGRVLYLVGEGASGFIRRADAWQLVNLKRRTDVEDLHIVDDLPLLWRGEADDLLLAAPGPYDLVILDTVARSLVGADENSSQDVGSLIAGAEKIRRTGACVLLLHHLNRQGETRGSTALSAAVHTRLRIKREGASRVATLTVEKQRDAEPDEKLILVARSVDLGTTDSEGRPVTSLVLEMDTNERPPVVPVKKTLKPTSITAWSALVGLGGQANFAAWRDAATLAKSTFTHAREELLEHGYVEHEPSGPWRLTSKGSKGPGGSIQGPLGSDGPSADEVGPGGSTTPLKGVAPGPSSPDPRGKALPW